MEGRGQRFYRGVIDLPTVLILVAAAALWRLWPAPPPERAGVVRRVPGVSFERGMDGARMRVLSPELFALPSSHGFGRDEVLEPGTGVPGVRPLPEPRFLARSGPGGAVEPLPGPGLAALVAGRMGEHRLNVDAGPAFDAAAAGAGPGLRMVAGGALRRAGFRAEDATKELEGLTNTSWMVTLSVTLGDDGRPADVFVEHGSGDSAVDAAVVRAIARGSAGASAGACAGRLTVNFGRP